jgi:hypothetical protein
MHQRFIPTSVEVIAQAEVYTRAAEQKRMAARAMNLLTMLGTDVEQSVPPDGLVQESGTISAKKITRNQ